MSTFQNFVYYIVRNFVLVVKPLPIVFSNKDSHLLSNVTPPFSIDSIGIGANFLLSFSAS
ncbi:hypothetical protein [Companilactobacillus alimentarius]|uniref:hypothetical protein n=1 Tax=Companilactobacillus alimentarius TaxID=1602 RepID=UPI0028B5ABBD|nr:hypothetical protein [Companilactobacillus alimentarius]MDT6953559.1 hypothetical protein [Companilactobacillus alimentarius]